MTKTILATVTDEEAERLAKSRAKIGEAIDLMKKVERLRDEAMEEKRIWFRDMEHKYGFTEDKVTFDAETKTIRSSTIAAFLDRLTRAIKEVREGIGNENKTV